eukprot:TRINITY_DN9234_c0_g1_i1.p2 TRINITY_DN9234_c0_g1~~TRINITY_DN9234_c0_g1_i1.p2  ORF type:complete len:110 (+),score=5.95 TRINITY_DN9234_c0_g1_i1:195-524(+)
MFVAMAFLLFRVKLVFVIIALRSDNEKCCVFAKGTKRSFGRNRELSEAPIRFQPTGRKWNKRRKDRAVISSSAPNVHRPFVGSTSQERLAWMEGQTEDGGGTRTSSEFS